MRVRGGIAAWGRACHPLPSVAVTVFVAVVAVAAGRGAGGSAAVAAAVLAGQLSIGWCNDAVDARRDAAVGRTDKPAATGELRARVVGGAAGAALAACAGLSLLSGPRAAVAHLAGVVLGGWVYDLGVKKTALSPLPYAVGFASLPAFVTFGLPGSPWPTWWAVTGAALLGVGAHFLNVLPDIVGDRLTGVHGLPQRVGARWSRRIAPVVLGAAVAVLACGPPGAPGPLDWAVLAVAVTVATAGAVLPGVRSAAPFRAAVVVAALAVVLVVAHAGDLA
ncbi:UbiA family prenyltransferase [Yinghuangia sp. ASG 101]|uniref:UbiA family prenyltransferase n=1 Tax=Yinghuangia sp. ASG 101 TaxID=2896848 RepID=UPI001E49770D|nr:UbiA family prenyltransferase [Yinghuangia sp. ASG 101]UGQ12928.1 UbiA family prenyltransferase [Yinghuangia sp. ASG 101]